MRIKLEDLPSEYQQQIRDKIAVQPTNVESPSCHEPLAAHGNTTMDTQGCATYSLTREELESKGLSFAKYFNLLRGAKCRKKR